MQKNNKTTILLVSIILILLCFSLSATYATNHVTNDSINTNNDDTEDEGFVKSITDDTKPKHDSKNIETNNDKIDEEFLCSTTTISSFKDKEERKLKSNTDKIISSDKDLQNNNNADDDVVNSVYYINSSNLDSYFDHRGLLKKEFTDSILVFTGEFHDKGILTITQPNTIIGNYALFNNTAFCIESKNTLLSNLQFILTEEFYDNDYAGILILNDNVTIYNCTIDYTVPENTCGACVYIECGSYMKLNGLNLINNTFNIIGNNIEEGFAYGVYMEWVNNPVIYGNRINAELPLKAVDWSQEIYGGARMDTVGAFLADTCENLTLTNNHITTKATYRGNKFPTLDTVLIYACNNSVIENNRIYSEDYYTKEDQDNYLQGIDLYISNNVTIIGNQIDIRTTGGSENMGTAYPIQVTGPSRDVKIVYNHISSVNNGPNIGVYSQNFYGATQINIISNFINITGKANKHNWALVTGIEVQDSDDIIMNNTIIVTNKNAYNDDYNVYGISYSQNTNNNHTYNIQYNTVTTNGRYAVLLVGSNSLVVNSIIANNILNTLVNSGDDAVFIGNGTNNHVENNNGETTNTYSNDDLPDWLKNHKTIKPEVKLPHVKLPPLPEPIIKPQHTTENSNGSGQSNTQGNGMMPWNKNGTSNGLNNKATPTNPQNKNTPNKNSVVSNGTDPNSNHIKGSHDISLKIGGKSISRQSTAASPGESGSSAANNNKIYEVKEKTKKLIKENNNIPGILIAAIVLLLVFAGYKRKNKEQEE